MWQTLAPHADLTQDLLSLTLQQGPGGEGAPPPATGGGNGNTGGTTTQPGAPGANGPAPSANPMGNQMLFMLFAIMAFFLVVSLFSGRKEKKKRQELLSSIRKGDEVETIGGVIGTVMQVKDDEVLLKVDENANTKIRFRRSAVQTVRDAKARTGTDASDDDTDADDAKD